MGKTKQTACAKAPEAAWRDNILKEQEGKLIKLELEQALSWVVAS